MNVDLELAELDAIALAFRAQSAAGESIVNKIRSQVHAQLKPPAPPPPEADPSPSPA